MQTELYFLAGDMDTESAQNGLVMSVLRSVGEQALGNGPCLSSAVDRARDRAALLSMASALVQFAGDHPGRALEAEEIIDDYRSIVSRWLEELSAAGWLSAEEDPSWRRTPPAVDDVEAAWKEAMDLAPEPGGGGALTGFFTECARVLPELLTGKIQVQSLLFDNGDITREIYQANEASRYTNAIAAAAIRQRCCAVSEEGRVPVILEVGGGIGGTTDVVLDQLTDMALHYHFTDVGELFTVQALERWAGRAGLTSGVFDINASREEQLSSLKQGFRGKFDVVLAANVMHNAVDVCRSLSSLAALCRKKAELILIETGTEHLPLLISMRFLMTLPPPTPGIGGDRAAKGRMLLTAEQWSAAIAQSGWQLIELLPGLEDHIPVARYDQRVWRAVCQEQLTESEPAITGKEGSPE